MSEPKVVRWGWDALTGYLVEMDGGEYVRYSDHALVVARVEELEKKQVISQGEEMTDHRTRAEKLALTYANSGGTIGEAVKGIANAFAEVEAEAVEADHTRLLTRIGELVEMNHLLTAMVKELEKAREDDDLETVKTEYLRVQDENKRLEGDIDELLEALVWCSGSADFGPGGYAHKGWVKECRPLLDRLIPRG